MRCDIAKNYCPAKVGSLDSFLFHQAHHRILKAEPFLLEFFRVCCPLHVNWSTKDNVHSGKWARQDEAVPALETPATRVFDVRRYDLGVTFLGEKNDTLTELINRAARTIWRENDVCAARENFGESQQSACTAAGT